MQVWISAVMCHITVFQKAIRWPNSPGPWWLENFIGEEQHSKGFNWKPLQTSTRACFYYCSCVCRKIQQSDQSGLEVIPTIFIPTTQKIFNEKGKIGAAKSPKYPNQCLVWIAAPKHRVTCPFTPNHHSSWGFLTLTKCACWAFPDARQALRFFCASLHTIYIT